MKIEEQLLAGLKDGVDRHWRYTKEFLHIKPEYLLTVSVADALTNGFNGFHGLDIQIRLEEPTKSVLFELVTRSGGLKKWFKSQRPKLSRKGKVDIFLMTEGACHAVELKGFDPSAVEIEKDLVRLQQLLAVNDGSNKLASCHVVFPTLTNRSNWIEKRAKSVIDLSTSKYDLTQSRHETGEDPEDGVPCYYANCLTVARR